ncbi:uncharacterized protein LOC110906651 [Helianthus annuus]|uniref:uncharacterized protein LOC110906651 n=1 Tax=Helianthus annuus TaxID=4232 RepID=UPI000B8F77D2|nr:uncharacterized protein LOC110906651 [Helianthus annuus]
MDEVAEAVVIVVAGEILLGENLEPLLEPLSDPWSEEEEKKHGEKEEKVTDEKEHACDCAMMAAAKTPSKNSGKNAKLETKDKKPLAISSCIKGVPVKITPQTISEVFELNDHQGKTSFPKTEYQTDFLERGYEEEMKKDTLQKEGVDKLDTSVADSKSMLQQLLQAQKATPTTAPAATSTPSFAPTPTKLWELFQPLLHKQREYADQQHEIQFQKIRNLMEARFMNTQADIKAIKAHLLKTVDKSSMLADLPRPDGSKKVDVTLNAFADEKARLKKDMEAKGKSRFEQEKKVFMEMEEQGISEPKDDENPKPKRKQPTRKVRKEIKSFYSEDDPAKRSLPSLQGYPRPNNIEEYLKLKAQQAEDISKRNSQGKSDKEIQRYYQYLLTQVSTLERFSKDLFQKLSERDDESLRKDYIKHIMAFKKYKGEKAQYKEWTLGELKEELERIEKMNKDKVKHTPPIWSKYKKNVPENTLKLKRMKQELITADFGSRNQVTRWSEDKVIANYKKLEELRKKNPNVPQKPDYPEAVVPAKPQKLQIRRSTTSPAAILYQRRKQKQMDVETEEDIAQGDYIIKMNCPDHGVQMWELLNAFHEGLIPEDARDLSSISNGTFGTNYEHID